MLLLGTLPPFAWLPLQGLVDGWAVSAAACHAGGPGLIPGPGPTYVYVEWKRWFVPTTLVQKNPLNKLFLYVVKQIKQHTRVKHSWKSSATNSHTQWNELLPTALITKDRSTPNTMTAPARNATAPRPKNYGGDIFVPCKSIIHQTPSTHAYSVYNNVYNKITDW
jgi:hypothetical protein